MLEIVLLILKIAGIIFASILGILIVLICALLFVPVRYRGDFSAFDAEEGDKRKVCADFRATWFLRLVRVYAACGETVRVRVKILFFTLSDTAGEKKEKKKGKTKERSKAEKEQKTSKAGGAQRTQETEAAREREAADADLQEKKEKMEEDIGRQRSDRPEGEKRSMKSAISNIMQTIRSFCDKLKEGKEKAERIEKLWISDPMANSRSLLRKQFVYLLKHTKPKKLWGYIRFGFEDPSATGYAMAVYGILYPIWSPKLSVEPDFEKQVLACHILLKGKIRVWHPVKAALRMILSRDARRVIRDVKKL